MNCAVLVHKKNIFMLRLLECFKKHNNVVNIEF